MRKFFLFIFSFFLFVGCGYKPSSVYQSNILGKNIKPEVMIDPANPRETIFLKDAVNDAVYTLLGDNVCTKNCDSVMTVNANSSSVTPIDYDQNGIPVLYRSTVVLNVTIKDKNGKKRNYTVSGIYDFKVSADSILTDQAKLDAYKNASINALNKLFAEIAKDGMTQ
ncbi:LPS assembly lipoprotein LptE [Caminibacter sp.]